MAKLIHLFLFSKSHFFHCESRHYRQDNVVHHNQPDSKSGWAEEDKKGKGGKKKENEAKREQEGSNPKMFVTSAENLILQINKTVEKSRLFSICSQ